MKIELSAGGVVISKAAGSTNILLIRDMNGNWTFPKGIIEPGEDPVSAAIREIAEETGVTGLTLLKGLPPVSYTYTRGEPIQKTVQYFLFETDGSGKVLPQKEEGISEVVWVSLDEALGRISYKETNVPLLELAAKHL